MRLTREEHAALKALCTETRITYSRLLEAFIADVTQSRRCCGTDFDWWLEVRAFGHPFLSCYGRGETYETVSQAEIARRHKWLWLWQGKSWSERGRVR
ncbi:MAG: hypothetical protein PHQ12_03135 [Chthoniobacteraceae bacterium]|nr:hypothetical protein [Chthoniobacteraceae bacterium]